MFSFNTGNFINETQPSMPTPSKGDNGIIDEKIERNIAVS